jgi:hypothetical protein
MDPFFNRKRHRLCTSESLVADLQVLMAVTSPPVARARISFIIITEYGIQTQDCDADSHY